MATDKTGTVRLYEAIFGAPPGRDISPDDHGRLNEILDMLTDREAIVLRKRFFEGLTRRTIGEQFYVTPDRIRQIEGKALRKLRRPAHKERVRELFSTYAELGQIIEQLRGEISRLQEELDSAKADNAALSRQVFALEHLVNTSGANTAPASVLALPLEEVGFSTQVYYLLHYRGFRYLGEVARTNREELRKIRGLGQKCLNEIIEVLTRLGAIPEGAEDK